MNKSITVSTLIILLALVTLSSCVNYRTLERMRQENDTKERLIKELQKYSNSISNYNDQLKQQIEVFEKRKIERNKKNIGNTEHIDNTQALLKKYNSFFAKYHKYQQHKQSLRETAQDVIDQKKAMLENLKTALHELENLLYASVGEYEQTILISHLRQRKLLKNQLRKLNNEINQSMLYVKQMLKLEEENLKFNYSISRLQEIKYNYRVNTGSNLESMPNFPWPPLHPSAYSVIPSTLLPSLTNNHYLKNVAEKLETAFDQAGYSQKKYYQVPDGFALVSQLEQFNSDGTSKTPPDRWSIDFLPPKIFSLTSYLKALFTANPGRYRIIAFIVTSQPFEESKKTVTREEAMAWLDNGMIILPESIGKQPYTDKHYCTAFIYEFEQPGRDKKPFLKPLSNLTGRDHLQKSNLWTALQQ